MNVNKNVSPDVHKTKFFVAGKGGLHLTYIASEMNYFVYFPTMSLYK